jgi:thiol-disulfide isomerase/thioredoxin
MPERTWKAAFVEVSRAAAKHKLVSGLIAIAVVGSLAALGWAGSEHPSATAAAEGPGQSNAAASVGSAAGVGDGEAGAVRPAGDPAAAAFSVPVLGSSGVTSQKLSLAGYANKPLIVNFFASWCSPCQQETPLLASFYRGEHGKIALVGLDENDVMANALKFTRAKHVGYPVGWDPQITVAAAYDVNAMPQTFFLDAAHRIVYRVYGAVTSAELAEGTKLATG